MSKMLELAGVIDAWRVFPRLMVGAYVYLMVAVVDWFMLLPDPNTQQAALVTTVIGGATGIFGLYVGTGKGKS